MIALQGARCEDGRALFFAYSGSLAFPERSAWITIGPFTDTGYGGYMLFTGPGNWNIDVFSQSKFVGNLVMTVVVS